MLTGEKFNNLGLSCTCSLFCNCFIDLIQVGLCNVVLSILFDIIVLTLSHIGGQIWQDVFVTLM